MLQINELIAKYSESFVTPPSLSSERQRLLWEVFATIHAIPGHQAAETKMITFVHDEDRYDVLPDVLTWLYQAQQINAKNQNISHAIEILIGFYKEASLS